MKTTIGKFLGAAALALSLCAAGAMAQTAAAPSATVAPPAKSKFKLKTPATAAGKACSDQADAKNLHGKERRAFRSKCKQDMKKAA
jgi:hypothetical protein